MTGTRTLRRPLAAVLAMLALVTGSETATAAQERWGCCLADDTASGFSCGRSQNSFSAATLTADRTNGTGSVKISDLIVADTEFTISGLNRIWHWQNKARTKINLPGPDNALRMFKVEVDVFNTFTMSLNGSANLEIRSVPASGLPANTSVRMGTTTHSFMCRKR